MDAKLVVVSGNATKGEVKLKLPMTIGRAKEAGLSIAHPMVSRLHCTLFEMTGAVVIRDNNSANGTYINDQRISEAVLKPGDKLTVGPLTFVAIYKHSGKFPTLGGAQPAAPSNGPAVETDSEADLGNFVKMASKLSGSDSEPTVQQDSKGSTFQDIMNEIPDVNLNVDSSDGIEFFQNANHGEVHEAWEALDDEEDEDTLSEEEEVGEVTQAGGETTDINAFFQDLLEEDEEDSLLQESDEGNKKEER